MIFWQTASDLRFAVLLKLKQFLVHFIMIKNGSVIHCLLKSQVMFSRYGSHSLKENAELLVVASKQIGQEVNADKTKYMVMSQDQNAG